MRLARPTSLFVAFFMGLLFLGSTADAQRVVRAKAKPAKARAVASKKATTSKRPGQAQTELKLKTVVHEGKEYVQTFRVTSKTGLARIKDRNNGFRFFGGGGQYGEGLYLFTKHADALKFRGTLPTDTKRTVISEILLPKDMFTSVKKSLVLETHDWGKNADSFRSTRLDSHILFGRWAPSPNVSEPAFEPMNGTMQLSVKQLGAPSILHKAVIREVE